MSPAGKLRELPLDGAFYASSRNDMIREFYVPCLESSVRYDRAVGYFRSSILAVAGIPFSSFAERGGRARFLCSPELTEEDAAAIREGYRLREVADAALQREMDEMLRNPAGERAVRVLATLVAMGSVDFRIVLKGSGIFHHKIGMFEDEHGDAVSFIGSTNESWSGWSPSGNDESFEVFTSWGADADRVTRHGEFFASMWGGHEPGMEVMSLPDAFRERLLDFKEPSGDIATMRSVFAALPSRPDLFPHQRDALEDWLHHGQQGILEHATGSGKTITALEAIRRWLHDQRPALVIVPSELLLEQWKSEAERYLAELDPPILMAGGRHSSRTWQQGLSAFTEMEGRGCLIIATIQTAASTAFLSRANVENLLVVIDEVHRAGSPVYQQVLTLDAVARLGLSATPVRANDAAGTEAIARYFERTLVPRFTLRDAIDAGRLCPYTYFVHEVTLSEEEQATWDKLTHDISIEIARSGEGGALPDTERLKHLLIRRARVIKGAAEKTRVARQVLAEHYTDGASWLVYCDDQRQLGDVMSELHAAGLPAMDYHSNMGGDRAASMSLFEARGGILVAIRCLDEGVDIPKVSHALVLASSRNPREFIQRRGRVLRRHPGKHVASIHDALVLPHPGASASIEARLVGPELARAALFARDALNRATALALEAVASRIGLDIGSLSNEGEEVDD